MFYVEKNARDRAAKIAREATSKGATAKQATRAGRKQEAKQVKRDNAWIKKNVGLD